MKTRFGPALSGADPLFCVPMDFFDYICSIQLQHKMTIREIAKLVDGEIVGAPVDESYEVEKAFASDLMSDVLRFSMDETVLITGLCNNQTMRTAEMADLRVVVLGRDKQPDADMLALAEDIDITIVKSKFSIFKISGILYNAGIKPLY